jgi:hypothetical protein
MHMRNSRRKTLILCGGRPGYRASLASTVHDRGKPTKLQRPPDFVV